MPPDATPESLVKDMIRGFNQVCGHTRVKQIGENLAAIEERDRKRCGAEHR